MKPAGSQTWHAEGKESTFLDNNFHSSFCISWCKSHCFNRAFGSDWLFSARALPSTTKAKHHWEEKVPSISLTVDLKWSYRESRGKLIPPLKLVLNFLSFLFKIIPSFIFTVPDVISLLLEYYWSVLNWKEQEDSRPGNDYMKEHRWFCHCIAPQVMALSQRDLGLAISVLEYDLL